MADIFDEVAQGLQQLGDAIADVTEESKDFVDVWGANTPVLDKDEIAECAYKLSTRVSGLLAQQRTEIIAKGMEYVPAKLAKFRDEIVPELPGENAGLIVALLWQLINFIDQRLPPLNWPVEWEAADNAGMLPKKIAGKLRGLEASVEALEPRAGDLDVKIKVIEDAHSTAETLPTDMASLAEERAKVAAIASEVEELLKKARDGNRDIETNVSIMRDKGAEAATLMRNIDSAYRASTSKALADAFAKRSFWLQAQTWVFVLLLIAALAVGGYLGFHRVSTFETLLKSGRSIDVSMLWINIALSFLSIAAPVWFAWVATKQITQRFKLAEDYGFKAAVAKAYEGYRREAASVDPLFVTRLFGSALARLEEAPLRLVDQENYGSPFHELTASPAFRDALGVVPALQEKYSSILDSITKRTKQGATEAASALVASSNVPAAAMSQSRDGDEPTDEA